MEERTTRYEGSLIAFEGAQEVISTQLRLLPSSAKTLVLPPIERHGEDDNAASPFDAREFILKTHEAYHDRAEMARSFLEESTADDKRLVFMNGGTATAYMTCIAAISRHETRGDITKAQTIFRKLVRHGITGLRRPKKAKKEESTRTGTDGDNYEALDDPVSRAMRAADALDLETASLQSVHVLDLTYAVRPRSTSVPARPMFNHEPDLLQHPLPDMSRQSQILKIEKWRNMAADEEQLADPNSASSCPSVADDMDSSGPLTPVDDSQAYDMTTTNRTSPALVGKAQLVDIRPPSLQPHRRTTSANQIAIGDERGGLANPLLRSRFHGDHVLQPINPDNTGLRRGPRLRLTTPNPKQPVPRFSRIVALERNYMRKVSNRDAENDATSESVEGEAEIDANAPFETVLPMIEDMVIYFKGDESDPGVEAIIQSFRDGTYPVTKPAQVSKETGEHTVPASPPRSRSSTPNLTVDTTGKGQMIVEQVRPIYLPDVYDPFAPTGDYTLHPATIFPPKKAVTTTRIISVPPTPAQTPPPPGPEPLMGKVIRDFHIAEYKTAVAIQDSLRVILADYFPSEGDGYQFDFPLLPGFSSFWQPVFRTTSTEGLGTARNVHLILAVGAQQNADRDFLHSVSCSLEKLGLAPNGNSRSGKLDFRYLVASAIRSLTVERRPKQAQADILSNPTLLATVIMSHLETYLAAHPNTGFLLLEYPAEYLGTVLALQKLVGADILKVAGIVDGKAPPPRPYRSYQNLARDSSRLSQTSFSKANFILTSAASEMEIAKFIVNIWALLIGISTIYVPIKSALEARADDYRTHDYSSEETTTSALYHVWALYPPLAKAAVMLGFAPSPAEQPRRPERPSTDHGSIRTYADLQRLTPAPTPSEPSRSPTPPNIETAAGHNIRRRPKLQNLLGADVVAAAVASKEFGDAVPYFGTSDDEEGIVEDAERKYVPSWKAPAREAEQATPRKGGSRKALRWLGLS
ncbi:hypothetical protein GGS20DRAFT_575340 [Poronia punctata]|nr:hypothetical protein GGS20DRAFT_575340 [Poronia punctata]